MRRQEIWCFAQKLLSSLKSRDAFVSWVRGLGIVIAGSKPWSPEGRALCIAFSSVVCWAMLLTRNKLLASDKGAHILDMIFGSESLSS